MPVAKPDQPDVVALDSTWWPWTRCRWPRPIPSARGGPGVDPGGLGSISPACRPWTRSRWAWSRSRRPRPVSPAWWPWSRSRWPSPIPSAWWPWSRSRRRGAHPGSISPACRPWSRSRRPVVADQVAKVDQPGRGGRGGGQLSSRGALGPRWRPGGHVDHLRGLWQLQVDPGLAASIGPRPDPRCGGRGGEAGGPRSPPVAGYSALGADRRFRSLQRSMTSASPSIPQKRPMRIRGPIPSRPMPQGFPYITKRAAPTAIASAGYPTRRVTYNSSARGPWGSGLRCEKRASFMSSG